MKRAKPGAIASEVPEAMSFPFLAVESRAPAGERAEPLLKWAGGKRWLAPQLGPVIEQQLLLKPRARYVEPFLGGGAVALWLGDRGMVLGDVEAPLISMYVAVRDDWCTVQAELRALVIAGTDRNTFLEVRASRPRSAARMAARLIYLNRLCFNGLYRTNSRGQFNVPYGDYAAPAFPTSWQLSKVSGALANASLRAGDFESMLAETRAGDVVYADPPYYSAGSGFRSYHQHPFSPTDHERLAEALRRAYERGATVFATNVSDPFVHRLYSWGHLYRTSERRAINCVGARRTAVRCVLISSIVLSGPFCSLHEPPGTSRTGVPADAA